MKKTARIMKSAATHYDKQIAILRERNKELKALRKIVYDLKKQNKELRAIIEGM